MSQRRIKAKRVPGLGATGKFPQGKMHASDEGGLKLAVAHDPAHGTVVIDFGTPVVWLGLPPDRARHLAALLIQHADELEAGPMPGLPQ